MIAIDIISADSLTIHEKNQQYGKCCPQQNDIPRADHVMLRQADGNTNNGGCCQCVEHARNALFLLFACHQETSSLLGIITVFS